MPFLFFYEFFLHSYLMLFCVQIRSVKTGSVFWSTLAALSYFYMVSMDILRQYIREIVYFSLYMYGDYMHKKLGILFNLENCSLIL